MGRGLSTYKSEFIPFWVSRASEGDAVYVGECPFGHKHDGFPWRVLQRGIWCNPASPACPALEHHNSQHPIPILESLRELRDPRYPVPTTLEHPTLLSPSQSILCHPGLLPQPCSTGTPILQAPHTVGGSKLPWPHTGAP